MENERFFKQLTVSQFVKAIFLHAVAMVVMTLLFIPAFDYIAWLIKGSGPFVAFPTSSSKLLYFFLVTILLFLQFREDRSFYRRMKEVPFLTILENGIYLDKKMLPFPREIGGGGKSN